MQQRPQSAMDFTRNNKLDLFTDFADPFQPTPTNKIVHNKIPEIGKRNCLVS